MFCPDALVTDGPLKWLFRLATLDESGDTQTPARFTIQFLASFSISTQAIPDFAESFLAEVPAHYYHSLIPGRVNR